MPSATRLPIENPCGHATCVDECFLEVRGLVDRNEMILRTCQDQYVLPDAIGDRRESVSSACLNGFFDVLGTHRPQRIAVGPRNGNIVDRERIFRCGHEWTRYRTEIVHGVVRYYAVDAFFEGGGARREIAAHTHADKYNLRRLGVSMEEFAERRCNWLLPFRGVRKAVRAQRLALAWSFVSQHRVTSLKRCLGEI